MSYCSEKIEEIIEKLGEEHIADRGIFVGKNYSIFDLRNDLQTAINLHESLK